MAQTPAEHLGDTIILFSTAFDRVSVLRREERPDRSLLEMWGWWGTYQVRFLEVLPKDGPRKYAYYVLKEEAGVIGFDNASDPRVLRLKYGKDVARHQGEGVPHMHGSDKSTLQITEEMKCGDFIAWVQVHLLLAA